MFKGQKTLAALAVSLLFTAPVYAADEGSGEIHFKGEVIEAPCEIHPEDIDKNIDRSFTCKRPELCTQVFPSFTERRAK